MTANRQEGNFLAGGEIPVPIAQPGQGGATFVTITYREFGIRLRFVPEILSDSLITLAVRPEVSTLDYTNAVIIAGFRVPALRTRRVETTVDVRPNESLIISGLMSEDRERVRNGIPLLMDIPILGALFSSTPLAVFADRTARRRQANDRRPDSPARARSAPHAAGHDAAGP